MLRRDSWVCCGGAYLCVYKVQQAIVERRVTVHLTDTGARLSLPVCLLKVSHAHVFLVPFNSLPSAELESGKEQGKTHTSSVRKCGLSTWHIEKNHESDLKCVTISISRMGWENLSAVFFLTAPGPEGECRCCSPVPCAYRQFCQGS